MILLKAKGARAWIPFMTMIETSMENISFRNEREVTCLSFLITFLIRNSLYVLLIFSTWSHSSKPQRELVVNSTLSSQVDKYCSEAHKLSKILDADSRSPLKSRCNLLLMCKSGFICLFFFSQYLANFLNWIKSLFRFAFRRIHQSERHRNDDAQHCKEELESSFGNFNRSHSALTWRFKKNPH